MEARERKEPKKDHQQELETPRNGNRNESSRPERFEVASAIEVADSGEEEEVNVSGIPSGALVLLPKKAGVRVPWDDELRIVDTKEVLAIVSEVDIF
jgi:sRNA-binding protein